MKKSKTTIIQKARNNDIEVEDILQLVKTGNKETLHILEKLRLLLCEGEKRSDEVPFDKWICIVATYFEYGISKIVYLAKEDMEYSSFAISVLEELKTYDAFVGIIEVLESCVLSDNQDYKLALKCLAALNLMISFDDEINYKPQDEALLRSLIHHFLNFCKEKKACEEDIVVAYCAVRKVGDASTITLIKSMPSLVLEEYSGLDKTVMNKIKKRL